MMEVKLETSVTFDFVTSVFATGAVSDADSTPSFEVFEADTDTALTLSTSSIAKRTSKTGNYRATFTAAAADGFEAGKYYNVVATATVSSVAGKGVIGRFRAVAALLADGVNVTQVNGSATTATLDSLSAQISAVGSGTGAALNFEVAADNASSPLNGVTKKGTASGGTTYANTLADNNVYHTIVAELDTTYKIDWVYKFTCGGGRVGTKAVIRASMAAVSDTVNVQVYNFSGTAWRTIGSITGTTETLYDLPLYSGDTGTGTDAGVIYLRFVFDEADTGTINIDQCYVTAQNLGQTIGYANGSIWVSSGGTALTTPYVSGTGDNPATWAAAKTLSTALGIKRFTVTPGTTVTLDAALTGSVMTGRSYTLALGSQNISSSYFEGCEGLSGTGTCATGEAIIVDCHLNAITIGEADFVRCHLMGEITMSQDSVPYRFHDCTGITGATITFTGSAQAAVISRMSGVIAVAGLQSGNTLYVDGDGVLSLAGSGGTVYVSGAVRLSGGTNQTIYRDGTLVAAEAAQTAAEAVTGYATESSPGAIEAAAKLAAQRGF